MEEKLTELQENHFSLYDTSCKDYDNYIVKRNVLEEIVRTLSITGKWSLMIGVALGEFI